MDTCYSSGIQKAHNSVARPVNIGKSTPDILINNIKVTKPKINLSSDVTVFLDNLHHPFRKEIEKLRKEILNADNRLRENIKWNGPNYCLGNEDRITIKIQPPKLIQIIFHRGAKVQKQPKDRLIKDSSGLLTWKENDRAIATFKNMPDIEKNKEALSKIVKDWISATLQNNQP